MLTRLSRVVLDVTSHTRAARELSLGLYEALNVLTRRGSPLGFESTLRQHDAAIRSELPGF